MLSLQYHFSNNTEYSNLSVDFEISDRRIFPVLAAGHYKNFFHNCGVPELISFNLNWAAYLISSSMFLNSSTPPYLIKAETSPNLATISTWMACLIIPSVKIRAHTGIEYHSTVNNTQVWPYLSIRTYISCDV